MDIELFEFDYQLITFLTKSHKTNKYLNTINLLKSVGKRPELPNFLKGDIKIIAYSRDEHQ